MIRGWVIFKRAQVGQIYAGVDIRYEFLKNLARDAEIGLFEYSEREAALSLIHGIMACSIKNDISINEKLCGHKFRRV